ncbi:hypothetical protein TNCT_594681 [Trichonephila clavata]|uniref:Uncharacterized protein n=1 Tax=Trichonephila clavata TaxID=2740835 RepID=A0A8X6F419_TRICU|nr:hypothetical protein TNCT_594681 [Trichonephila clavata]
MGHYVKQCTFSLLNIVLKRTGRAISRFDGKIWSRNLTPPLGFLKVQNKPTILLILKKKTEHCERNSDIYAKLTSKLSTEECARKTVAVLKRLSHIQPYAVCFMNQ